MALSATTASGTASGASSPAAKAAAGPRPSPVELRAMGKRLRETCPRSSHAVWNPGHTRADPLRLLEASNTGRIPQLIPIRHARMARSPFTFCWGGGPQHSSRPGRHAHHRSACAGVW